MVAVAAVSHGAVALVEESFGNPFGVGGPMLLGAAFLESAFFGDCGGG